MHSILFMTFCKNCSIGSLKDIDLDQTDLTDETLSLFLSGSSTSLVKVMERRIVREAARKRVGLAWSSM